MNFVDKVLSLIEESGIKKNKLLTDIGISKNSIVDWIGRGTTPSGDVVVKIAKYFGVTTDYLLGMEGAEKTKTPREIHLWERHGNICKKLDKLTDIQLAKVEGFIDCIVVDNEAAAETAKQTTGHMA